MPYQSTWINPYLPVNGPGSALGQSVIPPQQAQLMGGWQQPVNGVIKVNGRDSALQYQLPPNSMSPALFDNNGKVFYVVSTDGTGTKSVETFDFSPHEDAPVQIDGARFVSREEYDQFVAKVSAALEVINGVHESVPTTATGHVTEPGGVHGTGQNQHAQGLSGGQPSGVGGPVS